MWWLQPGWKQTECAICSKNIWDTGGDPDHGLCYDCLNQKLEWERGMQDEYEQSMKEEYEQRMKGYTPFNP